MQSALRISERNASEVKVGLTVWGSRISPVFDSARTVLVAEIENGTVVGKSYGTLGPELPYARASRLAGLGINVLICGAISIEYARTIEVYKIQVIPFITGEVQQVLDAYLRGMLIAGSFQMPGCGMRRRKRFRGGRG